MSRQHLTFVCLAALGTLAGVLFLAGGDAALPPLPEAETDADPADSGSSLGDAPIDPAAVTDTADLVPDDALERGEVDEDPEETVQTLAIQVWDREDGVPAAGATVFVLDRNGLRWDETRGPFAEHWSAQAERRGRKFRTDDEGRVEVAGVQGTAVVAATLPGGYGYKWVRGRRRGSRQGDANNPRIEEVTLKADESVTIQVIDGAGQPVAGVPVGVVQRNPIANGIEELQQQVTRSESRIERIRRWMEADPNNRDRARDRMREVQESLRETRRSLGASQAHEEMILAGKADPNEPPSTAAVRTRRLTDKKGFAVFSHFQLYREEAQQGRWDRGGRDRGRRRNADDNAGGDEADGRPNAFFQAALLMPLPTPVSTRFAMAPLPTETLQLQMPGFGSVVLRTVDADGRPYTHPVRGELRVSTADPGGWSRVPLRKEQNEPTITFAQVGLGLTLEASCRLDDRDFRWTSEPIAGPTQPGETITVDLVVAPDAAMLYGRLVDDDGAPMRDVESTFLISSAGGRLEGEEVTTDDNGRFHLPYRVREDQTAPFSLEIRNDDTAPTRGIAAGLPRLPEAGITDLGDLTISEFGAIAQGVVLNDAGQPVRRAEVQLQKERPRTRGPEEQRGEMRFADESFVSTRTDEDGRFALYGDLVPGRYQLEVSRRGHFDAEVSLLPGGRDMRIELVRRCRLLGTLLLPEWMERDRLQLTLTRMDGASEDREPAEEEPRNWRGATYAFFDGIKPGTYDLSFRMDGFPDEFLKVQGLVVEPGMRDTHPRLQDIDLSRYLFRFEVRAVDQFGAEVSLNRPQLAKLQKDDGSEQFIGLSLRGNRGEVFSTQARLEVFPMAEGYLAEPQVLSAGRSDLVFQKVPPVQLQVAGITALAGTVPVRVAVERTDLGGRPDRLESFDGTSRRLSGWYRWSRYSSATVSPQDVAEVKITGGGKHKVTLFFGSRRNWRNRVACGEIDIQLDPQGVTAPIAISFDTVAAQEQIAAAAQAMAERAARDAQRGR